MFKLRIPLHFGRKLATALLHVNHLILTLIFNYLILTAALRVFSSVLLGYSHQAGRTGAVNATEPFEPGLYRQKNIFCATNTTFIGRDSSVEVSGGEVEVGAAGGNFLRK